MDERQLALAMHLEINPEDVTPGYRNEFRANGRDWLVVTDKEADQLARASVESLLDDLLSDVPENLRYYFDEDKYLDDVVSNDGRGSLLNHWDGTEYEVSLDNTYPFHEAMESWKEDNQDTPEEEVEAYIEECESLLDGTIYYIYQQ